MNGHVSEIDSPTSIQSNKLSSSESDITVDPELAAILQAFRNKDSQFVDWLEEAKSSNNNIALSVEVYFYKKVVNLETALAHKSETIKSNTNEMICYQKWIIKLKDKKKNLLAEFGVVPSGSWTILPDGGDVQWQANRHKSSDNAASLAGERYVLVSPLSHSYSQYRRGSQTSQSGDGQWLHASSQVHESMLGVHAAHIEHFNGGQAGVSLRCGDPNPFRNTGRQRGDDVSDGQ